MPKPPKPPKSDFLVLGFWSTLLFALVFIAWGFILDFLIWH